MVPVNSFYMPKYLNIRKDCAVRGISIIYGDAFGGDLPISSKSREGSSGQLCLRALTTGLLCFYSANETVKRLAEP